MLLEVAIADAYGVGFEYRDSAFVEAHNDLTAYYPHERYASLCGRYSDDTQMSLGIAELMLAQGVWDDVQIADYFVQAFKRDPREGYSKRLYATLSESLNGEELVRRIVPKSERSGAAMRSGVIGLYQDTDEVLTKAERQARITHNTTEGKEAAKAASLLTHFFAYQKGCKKEVGKYISDVLKDSRWAEEWSGEVGSKGWMSVSAAITAIAKSETHSSLLKSCVAFTGDVDTVAAIAFSAAFFCREIKPDLPIWMFDELENEDFGRDYLKSIDGQLSVLFRDVIDWPHY
jgi:ADP-ribosyl-[dinitrogen reductase] hydrolase